MPNKRNSVGCSSYLKHIGSIELYRGGIRRLPEMRLFSFIDYQLFLEIDRHTFACLIDYKSAGVLDTNILLVTPDYCQSSCSSGHT